MLAFFKRLFGPNLRQTTDDFQRYSKDEKQRRSLRNLKEMLLAYIGKFKKSPFENDRKGEEARKFYKENRPSK